MTSTVFSRDAARGVLMGLAGLMMGAVMTPGCDTEDATQPLAFEVSAITGTACGDPAAPSPGVNPFADINNVTVVVERRDPLTGVAETIAKESTSLRGAAALQLNAVPEGLGHEVTLFASGASGGWYARDLDVDVRRNTDNVVDLLLTRYGSLSCVTSPATAINTMFSSSVTLGDGRILVTGGFTALAGDGRSLIAPTDQAYLFNSATGEVRSMGSMGANQGRGGHSMVYLASSDQVLIVGGTTTLGVDDTTANGLEDTQVFPFSYDKTNGRTDYVLFDVASEQFLVGTEQMSVPRAFARAHALADGTAVITGGGPWPFDPADAGFLNVEVFDPEDNGGQGGFLDVGRGFRSFYSRAGHSLTFLRETEVGLTQLLVWGGTTPERSLNHPAEVFRQSGRQRDGVNGTFVEVVVDGAPSYTYFHEVTRLAGERFLATGGAAFADGAIQAPAANEAWLLTYVDDPVPTIFAQRVEGMGAGRVFHGATSPDLQHVTVTGGLSGVLALTTDKVMFFDVAAQGAAWRAAPLSETFAPRGAHQSALSPSGSVLVVGGEGDVRMVAPSNRLSLEMLTPSNLPTP
ncbi:MAG: hypothetical protein ACI9MR_000293 [Myxococcota bacterium]|jgi:hypothetical protein